jgi:hypothetical protein
MPMEERMRVPITRLPRLALLLFSEVFVLSLSGNPAPAQAPDPLIHDAAPGRVRVMTAPAATVIRTDHYQAWLVLTCGAHACSGEFPGPGRNRRLNITRMSCYLAGSSGSVFRQGEIHLHGAGHTFVLEQYLPVDYSGPYRHVLNRAVDMQILTGQHMEVFLRLESGGTASAAECTATGISELLQ